MPIAQTDIAYYARSVGGLRRESVAMTLVGSRWVAQGWLGLAAGALAIAAVLALTLAISRTPLLMAVLPAAWAAAFHHVLVLHVVLSSLVWCLTALVFLACLESPDPQGSAADLAGLVLAVPGAGLLVTAAALGRAEAVLSDYVPVIDHPLYVVGLALVGLGVVVPLTRRLATASAWRSSFGFGLSAASLCVLAAVAAVLIMAIRLPAGLDPTQRSQLLFWGGGHLLQFAYAAMTLAAWHRLAGSAFGQAPCGDRLFRLAVASLIPPALAGVPLALTADPLRGDYLTGFTDLMRFGMAAGPALVGGAVVIAATRHREGWRSPAAVALLLSVLLFGLGGISGFFLDGGGDTRTPGHYHASLSGVNIALMGLVWVTAMSGRRLGLARLQLWCFGLGQGLFACGMFAAGLHGVPRKTAGLAQGLDSAWKTAAMALAGGGGIVAVLAGLLFAALVLWSVRPSRGRAA